MVVGKRDDHRIKFRDYMQCHSAPVPPKSRADFVGRRLSQFHCAAKLGMYPDWVYYVLRFLVHKSRDLGT